MEAGDRLQQDSFVLDETRRQQPPTSAGRLTVSTLLTDEKSSSSTTDHDVFDQDTYMMNPTGKCCNCHIQRWPRSTISCAVIAVVLAMIFVGSCTFLYLSSASKYIRY